MKNYYHDERTIIGSPLLPFLFLRGCCRRMRNNRIEACSLRSSAFCYLSVWSSIWLFRSELGQSRRTFLDGRSGQIPFCRSHLQRRAVGSNLSWPSFLFGRKSQFPQLLNVSIPKHRVILWSRHRFWGRKRWSKALGMNFRTFHHPCSNFGKLGQSFPGIICCPIHPAPEQWRHKGR